MKLMSKGTSNPMGNGWDIIHHIRCSIDGIPDSLLRAIEIWKSHKTEFNMRSLNTLYDVQANARNRGLNHIVKFIDDILREIE